jgi:two-component system CheB/CheR fusion protein
VIARFDGVRRTKSGRMLDVAISVSHIRDEGLNVIGASEVARDISDRKAAERKAGLLLSELDHRVKNILAIVLAVVTQTLRSNPDPAGFAVEIEGRIKAIAQAHSLLTEAGEGEMSLAAIFATELTAFRRAVPSPDHDLTGSGTNIDIAGPDVSLTPKAGLAMAMAIHELASNAAKYGALSVTTGHLDVHWQVDSGRILTLVWTERNGPPVQAPTRRGFGTTLIELTMAYQFDSQVRRTFAPGGVTCVFVVPLTDDVGHAPAPHDALEAEHGQ